MADQTLAQAGPVVGLDPRKRDETGTAEMPLVAISILNWNGWQDTIECLESVRQLDYPNYLTVVVDNGSWNGSADKIKAWAEENLGPGHVLAEYSRETALAGGDPEIEQALDRAASPARMVLIRNDENLGFTGGNNVSIHYALQRSGSAEYIFLLNNDAMPETDCLTQLLRISRDADAAVVGGELKPTHELQTTVDSDHPTPDATADTQSWEPRRWVTFGIAVLRRDILDAMRAAYGSYLDERLFMYGDDIDFCLRARARGYAIVHSSHASADHRCARSSGGPGNPTAYYYCTRNLIRIAPLVPSSERLRFYATHHIKSAGRLLKNLLRGRARSCRAIAQGLLDGHRGIEGKWKLHDQEVRAHAKR